MDRPTWEQERLVAHFTRIENELRRTGPPSCARARTIERLHAYRRAGVFPRNHLRPLGRPHPAPDRGSYAVAAPGCPIFVDEAGTLCGVAHLMAADLGPAAVQAVVDGGNERYVGEITEPHVGAWIARSGLTAGEIARIQPAYCYEGPPVTSYEVVMVGAAVSSGAFGVAAAAGRNGKSGTTLAIVDLAVGGAVAALPLLAPPGRSSAACYPEDSMNRRQTSANAAFAMGVFNVGLGTGLLVLSPSKDVRVVPWLGETRGVSVIVGW